MNEFNLKAEQKIESVEDFQLKQEPIKGQPELRWRGKRPFSSTQYYPAQLKETFGEETNGWINKIFWGDNLQVMSHLLKKYRGQVDLIYIDPPFDSKADYKKKITLRGKTAENDKTAFEEKQYTDIWSNDEYLQFMYERLILMRELLSEKGSIFLHCDWHKVHLLRTIMDEIFTPSNFVNEIIWCYYGPGSPGMKQFNRKHDNILWYSKSGAWVFNDDKIRIPHDEKTVGNFKEGLRGSGFIAGDYEIPDGKIPEDWWIMAISGRYPKDGIKRVGYPTEKPLPLLERIIEATTNEGDLVFDCFMGSGVAQTACMQLGRRFLGADINLGAIDLTVRRLCNVAKKINESFPDRTYYTGFEVWNVNNYDVFRNPIQAKDLLVEALELQPLPDNALYDGEKDGRMVKIMPINRIATRVDLNELITGFPRDKFDKLKAETPNKPVEMITLVCMGHEPDLGANLKLQMKEEGYNIDVEVVDILRDKVNLEFRRDSEADIQIEGDRLVIREFYPMNLLQKLSLEKTNIEEWRELVDSIKIDFNFDSGVFSPTIIDIPEGKDMVKGSYKIPADAGTIKVKITDLLSESCEVTINA